QQLGATSQQILRQLPLRVDELVDLFLDRPATQELVHEHVRGLTDAERAICRLILDRGIPPAVEVNHMRRGREVEPRAAGLERQDEERHGLVLLKPPHQRLAFLDVRPAVQDEPGPPDYLSEESGERSGRLSELRE